MNKLSSLLKSLLAANLSVKDFLHIVFGGIYVNGFNIVQIHQQRYVKKLHKRGDKIKVVFIASNLSLWKYERVYRLMSKDERFCVTILLSPIITIDKQAQLNDIRQLREYFLLKNIPFIDFKETELPFDLRRLDPDIIFYPQPYTVLLNKEHNSTSFYDKLLCYAPYGFWDTSGEWSYNRKFHNVAWKLFYATLINKNDAIRIAKNKGRNVVVSGYLGTDDFLEEKELLYREKSQQKRIIWAPHFSIGGDDELVHFSTFLDIADFMQNIAQKYTTIQWIFKPHPWLLSELYAHRDWGKERADAYYDFWRNIPNGQLQTGEYVDLFMTSDAMIHDCGSFTIEYLYTQNPVMYLTKDIEYVKSTKNQLGKESLDCHYIGQSKDDIISFVDNIVCNGKDTMKNRRKEFFDKYLYLPAGKTVARNIYEDLVKSLKLD
ncbi:MAG: CDP-glycerol glycerophosphotransferase family protein [Bacteroidales bacterium]|nr:CDP-glycerol glycerophosphotransferase family protein [Bacteroidales bacterium]